MTKEELLQELQRRADLAYELYQHNPSKYSMNYLVQEGRWDAFKECIELIKSIDSKL